MKKDWISIVTPCYNGESHLIPYINGLLSQTYNKVELIFVNDGSTDSTEKIILSYENAFKEKGWTFIYIKKENGGLANALNSGFQIFSGEFVCWIDSDDILSPTYFEEMSTYLKKHPDKGFVQCQVAHVLEKKHNKVLRIQSRQSADNDKYLLEDWLTNKEQNLYHDTFTMARSSAFLSVIPNRKIYDKNKSGQNAQIMFPLMYKYPAGSIQKVLAKYVVREKSDCHDIQKLASRQKQWDDNLYHVILNTDIPEYDKNYFYSLVKYNEYIKNNSDKYADAGQKNSKLKFYLFGIPFISIRKKKRKSTLNFLGIPLFLLKKKSDCYKLKFLGIPFMQIKEVRK